MADKNLKTFLKSKVPLGAELYRRARQWRSEPRSLETTFSDIYRNGGWKSDESVSGPGSTLAETEAVRTRLPVLLKEIGAHSMLDAPCGDFNWMKQVDLNLDQYIGADIVAELIARNQREFGDEKRRFLKLDLTRDKLPVVDLILCRDCLFHLSYASVFDALRNFKSSHCKYLLTTTFPHCEENVDILSGRWRAINLEIAPFNLARPIELINEDLPGKCLGLWKIDEIIIER